MMTIIVLIAAPGFSDYYEMKMVHFDMSVPAFTSAAYFLEMFFISEYIAYLMI